MQIPDPLFNIKDAVYIAGILIGVGMVYQKIISGHKHLSSGQKVVEDKVDTVTKQVNSTDGKLETFIALEKERHENLDVDIDELKGDTKRHSTQINDIKIDLAKRGSH